MATLTKLFARRGRIAERLLRILGPFAERGVLRGTAADLVDEARLAQASRLPASLWLRLDRLERARARATLRRIASGVDERARLVSDVDLYAAHLLSEWARGAGTIPFLYAVWPSGTKGVFRIPREDVETLAREAPETWKAFLGVAEAWTRAAHELRRECVGLFVECAALVGALAVHRRVPAAAEEEALDRLASTLDGRTPAATTDAEVALSLCRAYVTGLRLAGTEEAPQAPVEVVSHA